MAKTVSDITTKAATKRANAKSTKEDKPKRAPTAYNLFVQANLKPWREANADKTVKDAMVAVGAMWRDAPENPNRGKTPKARKRKADRGEKENDKAKTKAQPQRRASKKVEPESDVDEDVVASSDA